MKLKTLVLLLTITVMTPAESFANNKGLAKLLAEQYAGRFFVTQTQTGARLARSLLNRTIGTQDDFVTLLREVSKSHSQMAFVMEEIALIHRQYLRFQKLLRHNQAGLIEKDLSKFLSLTFDEQFILFLRQAKAQGKEVPRFLDESKLFFLPERVRVTQYAKHRAQTGKQVEHLTFVDDISSFAEQAGRKFTFRGKPRLEKSGSSVTKNEVWSEIQPKDAFSFAAPRRVHRGVEEQQLLQMQADLGYAETKDWIFEATLNFVGYSQMTANALNRSNRAAKNLVREIHGMRFDQVSNSVWIRLRSEFGAEVTLKHVRTQSAGKKQNFAYLEDFYGKIASENGEIFEVFARLTRGKKINQAQPGPPLYELSDSSLAVIVRPIDDVRFSR